MGSIFFESDVNTPLTHGDKDQAFKDMDNDRDYIYKYNDKGLDLPALRTYSLQHVIKAAEHTSTTAKKSNNKHYKLKNI